MLLLADHVSFVSNSSGEEWPNRADLTDFLLSIFLMHTLLR